MNINALRRYLFVTAITLSSLSVVCSTYAENIKIGVVNTDKILRESEPAIRANKRIEREFTVRDNEIKQLAKEAKVLQEKLENEGADMKDAERRNVERELANLSRTYQRAERQMREDLTVRQNEEYGLILELINDAIKQIAENEQYDLILQLQDSVYRSERIDITDKVINVLNKDLTKK